MKKTEQKYQTYVQILKEELIPAMGCTEPISLAYGASLARKVLNHLPTKIVVEASGSIIKNVKSVIVPHTHHLKGIKAAVCAGIIGGNDDKYLEVLSQIDEKTKKEIDQYIEKVDFEEHFLDSSKVFDYIITVWNKKEYVKVRISDSHMHVVCIEKNGKILQKEKSIIKKEKADRSLLDIKDIYTKGTFKYAKDVYASPQLILTIQAPDEEVFEKFVEENKQTIIDFFTRAEMNRQITLLEEKHSNFISQKIDSLFGCDIWIPSELNNSKTGEDFFWASTNTGSADRNFVMYSYPYTDKDTFTKEYFVHKRDSVMQVNIPGFKEGVYMSTDSLLTDVRPISVHNDYTMEARGLWRMKGDFMGGPFVSHTRLDQKNQRIITAEIFVYSPDKMKRNLVRQMESSLYTLRLPQEAPQSQIPLGVTKEAEPTKK